MTHLQDLNRLLQNVLEAETPDSPELQQALVAHALAHRDRYAPFKPETLLAESLAARSQLLRAVYPDLNQFCQRVLGWPGSPLDVMWRLWIPLAQWMDGRQQRLGRPLIQGILGGQGTGKTTLALILSRILAQLGHRVCCLSIDDFYKSYAERQQLQRADPRLIWRGPPGTHDVNLAVSVLQQLRAGQPVAVPRFDKSAQGGQGDRAAFESVAGATVVLLEGWLVGIRPIDPDKLDPGKLDPGKLDLGQLALTQPDLEWPKPLPWPLASAADCAFARDCNERLRAYLPLWEQLDRLLVLHPVSYRLSQRWRRQAEQAMMATGRSGLSDAEIDRFVLYFWRALPPDLFIAPLLRDRQKVDLVVEIDEHHGPQRIYKP
ncbi:MAG: glycerate kinase [Elainellaceae cyanobacterium]